MARSIFSPQLRSEYQRLFDTCVILPEKLHEVNDVIEMIANAKSRYESVRSKLDITWFFIAIAHCMEGSLSFHKHHHNGGLLTRRTTHVPKNRPKSGIPPFT